MKNGLNKARRTKLIERNKLQHLVPIPTDHSIIGTKWAYRNKLDKVDVIVTNKARLVAQLNQEGSIDYDKTSGRVTSLEVVRMLLAAHILEISNYSKWI